MSEAVLVAAAGAGNSVADKLILNPAGLGRAGELHWTAEVTSQEPATALRIGEEVR